MPKWNEQEYILGLLTSFDLCLPMPPLVVEFGALAGECLTKLFLHRYKHWSGVWIEPSPEFKTMQKVADGLGNVETHNCGVASHDGTFLLNYYPELPGASSMTIREHRSDKTAREHKGPVEQIEVPCRRLSTLLGDRKVGMMIVDVEECEIPILQDMIKSDVCPVIVMVEFSSKAARDIQNEIMRPRYRMLRRLLGPNNDIYLREDVAMAMEEEKDRCEIRF